MKKIIKLYNLRKSSKNSNYKKIYNKVILSYIINVSLLRKKEFKIKFKGKYSKPLKIRITEYLEYYSNLIDIKFFFHSKYYTKESKKLLYPTKPIFLKMLGNTNELVLEYILNKIDMEIKNETLSLNDTEYIISKKIVKKLHFQKIIS